MLESEHNCWKKVYKEERERDLLFLPSFNSGAVVQKKNKDVVDSPYHLRRILSQDSRLSLGPLLPHSLL